MKKQLLPIITLIAACTVAFTGCTETGNKSRNTDDGDNSVQEQSEDNNGYEDNGGCEDGSCGNGSGYGFIHPRTPHIRKDGTDGENGEINPVPPPCLPKEPHKDDGHRISPPPPMPKPMPTQPKN